MKSFSVLMLLILPYFSVISFADETDFNIHFSIILNKKEFSVGEPMLVFSKLKNHGQKTVRLKQGRNFVTHYYIKKISKETEKKTFPVKSLITSHEYSFYSDLEFVTSFQFDISLKSNFQYIINLKSNQATHGKAILRLSNRILPPGRYQIWAERIKDNQKDKFVSNFFEITIRKPTSHEIKILRQLDVQELTKAFHEKYPEDPKQLILFFKNIIQKHPQSIYADHARIALARLLEYQLFSKVSVGGKISKKEIQEIITLYQNISDQCPTLKVCKKPNIVNLMSYFKQFYSAKDCQSFVNTDLKPHQKQLEQFTDPLIYKNYISTP